jgi:hypothetical protein
MMYPGAAAACDLDDDDDASSSLPRTIVVVDVFKVVAPDLPVYISPPDEAECVGSSYSRRRRRTPTGASSAAATNIQDKPETHSHLITLFR